ncbi:MAG: hypothetical protein QM754_05385 [Tepidisphaeraceae bacterium]
MVRAAIVSERANGSVFEAAVSKFADDRSGVGVAPKIASPRALATPALSKASFFILHSPNSLLAVQACLPMRGQMCNRVRLCRDANARCIGK